jgi:hypothetical protein
MATAQFGPTCFLVAGMLPGPLRPHGTGENFSQEDDSNFRKGRIRTKSADTEKSVDSFHILDDFVCGRAYAVNLFGGM